MLITIFKNFKYSKVLNIKVNIVYYFKSYFTYKKINHIMIYKKTYKIKYLNKKVIKFSLLLTKLIYTLSYI